MSFGVGFFLKIIHCIWIFLFLFFFFFFEFRFDCSFFTQRPSLRTLFCTHLNVLMMKDGCGRPCKAIFVNVMMEDGCGGPKDTKAVTSLSPLS